MRKLGVVLAVVALAGTVAGVDRSPDPVVGRSTASTAVPGLDSLARLAEGAEPGPAPAAAPGPAAAAPPVDHSRLVAFSSCAEVAHHLKAEALARVTPWGVEGLHGGLVGEPVAADAAGSSGGAGRGSGASSPAPSSASSEGDHSGTNVQEAGVDEADLVKIDGARLFAVDAGRIHAVGLDGAASRLLGSFRLDDEHLPVELLLHRDRLIVLTSEHRTTDDGATEQWTAVRVLDVSDPGAMREVARAAVEGSYRSARLSAGIVRVATTAFPPLLPLAHPTDDSSAAQAAAVAQNRRIVDQTPLADWLPGVDLPAGLAGPGPADQPPGRVACDRMLRPAVFAGFGTVNVLSIDPERPDAASATSVTGNAETVYASTGHLYVAAPDWGTGAVVTRIHAFGIADRGPATYVASGFVPGTILGQWALSEHDGHLRIASTAVGPAEGGVDNAVTVLRREGQLLVPVGRLGGLGHPGEQIRGVRFMGDRGYVVTFRQTDPLYVLDLGDPARPTTLGELEIPGFSSYLHPVGDGRLLGVGSDADPETGQVTGALLSLFDVTDERRPRRTDHRTFGEWSQFHADHRAFLWWAPTSTAVIPLTAHEVDEHGHPTRAWSGAVVIGVDGERLVERVRLTHDDHRPADIAEWVGAIHRSVVASGSLYTVSELGVEVVSLDRYAEQAWVAFPQPAWRAAPPPEPEPQPQPEPEPEPDPGPPVGVDF